MMSMKVLKSQDSVTKEFNLVLNKILSKKYDWFYEIKIDEIIYDLNQNFFNMVGKIFVDYDWGASQWGEYHYSEPMPINEDDDTISFGDIIGGDFSKQLQSDFKLVFSLITGEKTLKYMSFSWIDVELVEKPDETNHLKLQESIKRILEEETESDLTPVIEKLVKHFVEENEDVLCKIEVIHPSKRKVLMGQPPYKNYKLKLLFAGGPIELRWKNDVIGNEIQDYILNMLGIYVDIYRITTYSCKEYLHHNIMREELDPVLRVKRRHHLIDEEIFKLFARVYTVDKICKNYQNENELLSVVKYAVIENLYFHTFREMDDESMEWREIAEYVYEYIDNKFGNKIKEYYYVNCGD